MPVGTKRIHLNHIEGLTGLHPNKNRRYTQLYSGRLDAHYSDANLGNLHIMRESLNVGARIEAAPAEQLLPFAFILPHITDFNFCGYQPVKHSRIQAGDGKWDVKFQHQFEYVSTVFDKNYFISGYEAITGTAFIDKLADSKITLTTLSDGMAYALGVNQILQKLASHTQLLHEPQLIKLLNSQILKLTINALTPSLEHVEKLKPQPKRIKGVQRVIDYLRVSVLELPDIQTLCAVANLSERSLQYGFLEYIGLTPIQYMRVLRLNGAHADLILAQIKTKVSDIAIKWGFIELGRFAKDYKSLFLELPSDTLTTNP